MSQSFSIRSHFWKKLVFFVKQPKNEALRCSTKLLFKAFSSWIIFENVLSFFPRITSEINSAELISSIIETLLDQSVVIFIMQSMELIFLHLKFFIPYFLELQQRKHLSSWIILTVLGNYSFKSNSLKYVPSLNVILTENFVKNMFDFWTVFFVTWKVSSTTLFMTYLIKFLLRKWN